MPVPLNLVVTTDPRLSDARAPLDGSVTNASVAANAAIVQSKLNLDGLIPMSWLGTTATTAAQGNLAEYFANKGQPNGYASLDGTGKVPVAQLPVGAGLGTVTSVQLTMPGQFTVTGNPITVAGTLGVTWNSIVGLSWFGNVNASSLPPSFSSAPLPVSLIPSLGTTKIVSGVFDIARIPLAVGVGPSHAAGAAPDPGSTGSVFDYLARDMTYKQIPAFGPGYQPVVPDPNLAINAGPPPYLVSITSSLSGVSLFYSINQPTSGFTPVPGNGQITLQSGQTAYVYGALVGYTNSNIVQIRAPTAPPTEVVTGDDGQTVTGDDSQPVTVGP